MKEREKFVVKKGRDERERKKIVVEFTLHIPVQILTRRLLSNFFAIAQSSRSKHRKIPKHSSITVSHVARFYEKYMISLFLSLTILFLPPLLSSSSSFGSAETFTFFSKDRRNENRGNEWGIW